MLENLGIFLRFYRQPVRAASEALDRGSFGFALTAVATAMLLWRFTLPGKPMLLFVSVATFFSIATLFLILVPMSIAVIAVWDSAGSVGVVLRREYLPVVVSAMFAWAAAYLPFALLQAAAPFTHIQLLAHIAFLGLYVVCLRTALGSTTWHSIVAVVVGWIAAFAALLAFPLVGSLSYFLFSPWVLYILYRSFASDVRSLGDSMNSRRNFRRQLDASMLNPHDADAHYQLGLIYQQRRQYAEAVESFNRALKIYPQDADTHLQLGRVLRAQGDFSQALGHFETALKLDSRVGNQEAWRDLGSVLLDLGRPQDAVEPLAKYTSHRAYDPEGLIYYGSALKSSGRTEEALAVFQQAVEAVKTAPKYRRGQLRRWANLAQSEMRKL